MTFAAGEPDQKKDAYFDVRQTFDVAFVDLCGRLGKMNRLALIRLFQRRLLSPISVIGVTLSFRDKLGTDYLHESTIGGFAEIQQIAREHG